MSAFTEEDVDRLCREWGEWDNERQDQAGAFCDGVRACDSELGVERVAEVNLDPGESVNEYLDCPMRYEYEGIEHCQLDREIKCPCKYYGPPDKDDQQAYLEKAPTKCPLRAGAVLLRARRK